MRTFVKIILSIIVISIGAIIGSQTGYVFTFLFSAAAVGIWMYKPKKEEDRKTTDLDKTL